MDDQPANLEVLGRMLSSQGFGVRAVTSGARAIEAATASPPDVILLDVAMPVMDGFETCRRIQSDDVLRHVPVLFLTAFDDAEHKRAAFDAGGRDYITKPFDADEVLARVRVHAALRRAEQELLTQHAAVLSAKEQLEEMAVMRARLSAMLVHDLKSPLTVIGALIDDPADTEALEDARVSHDKILRLVHELLGLYKSEHADQERRRARKDLRQIAETAAAASRYMARERSVNLVEQFPAIPCDVLCDPEQIDRVVSNLLDNAIKYTPPGGQVTVAVEEETGVGPESGMQFVMVSVRDTGPGIPAADLPYIFDPYRQREGTEVAGSVGLGLAIVQRLVASHGGRVRVHSREGVGSEFCVLLPAVAD